MDRHLAPISGIQTETFVLPGRAAGRREGKRIHFLQIERFLRRRDALPSRSALAGHDGVDGTPNGINVPKRDGVETSQREPSK